jgi:hypothetical protein
MLEGWREVRSEEQWGVRRNSRNTTFFAWKPADALGSKSGGRSEEREERGAVRSEEKYREYDFLRVEACGGPWVEVRSEERGEVRSEEQRGVRRQKYRKH